MECRAHAIVCGYKHLISEWLSQFVFQDAGARRQSTQLVSLGDHHSVTDCSQSPVESGPGGRYVYITPGFLARITRLSISSAYFTGIFRSVVGPIFGFGLAANSTAL